CASSVAAAPSGLAAASNPSMGADLSFTPAPGSAVTQVYRAPGACGAPAGDFQFVGSTAAGSYTDSRAEGGYTYAYRLRGADGGGATGAHFSSEPPWQVTATDAQAGTHSYHFGPDGGTYPPNTCASLTTPDLRLGNSSLLTYWIRYNAEYQWDGLVVEISNDLGVTWNDLPPTNPLGYPGTLALTQNPPINACGYQSTHGAFTGPTGNGALTAWTEIQTDLS